MRDALGDVPYTVYARNLPMIMIILLRAGLALAPLLSLDLRVSEVDRCIARRDGTSSDKSTSCSTTYAKSVLVANAA